MQNLIKQEQFEIEVLEKLNSKKIFDVLAFGGGTMLRLCWGLNRFSVDLDFWIVKKIDVKRLFKSLKECLKQHYVVRDATSKFYTLLLEIKSPLYPRSLKIEIRKEQKNIKTKQAIAYSPHSNIQVMLNTISLEEMMMAKFEALADRREIRDAFDIEFLLKKGISLPENPSTLKKALHVIKNFRGQDYTVKLGSLLESSQRTYYTKENFNILRTAIEAKLLMTTTFV